MTTTFYIPVTRARRSTIGIAGAARRILAGANSAAIQAVVAAETWAARRRQRRHLLALDHDSLADIGVSAADADHEGNKYFWQH